ncbi:uncharacterized protein LY89DRAFT_683593 [Mollisia scopiformis]|uniref:gluconokinase n=1 Tax=Mollisia scopiformis TaxID=149040 RepID=A0A194XES3_MOLSC|nr:uncharacterized protein LY89DRAFT_683593 [Mollisia scopiformis]KUJ18690.1 hypothetical protein LY89DRAFT_683593 [Mollisia scopiformis]
MAAGVPLTDDDRAGWLANLAAAGIEALSESSLVVVACSALKYKYREVFRTAVDKANNVEDRSVVLADTGNIQLDFIFLYMSQKKAKKLVRARALSTGHFMPASLVSSQFDILEMPNEKEPDCHIFDSNVGVEEVKDGTLRILDALLAHA